MIGKQLSLLQLFANQLASVITNTQIMQEKDRIFFDVAHTILTPVTSIAGFSERLMDESFQDESEKQEYIKLIAKSAELLKNVANEALYLTYFERMQDPLSPEWTVDHWLYTSLVNHNRFLLHERNMRIIPSSEKPMELFIDKDLMLRCLQALIDNAIKFSKGGARIWFRCTPADDGALLIEVKDEGVGIPEDEQTSIWTMYYRGPYARENLMALSIREQGLGRWCDFSSSTIRI